MRGFTDADALAVATWRYDGPWSIYNVSEPTGLSSENGYHAIIDSPTGVLVGFLCLGTEARVPGLAKDAGIADLGVGIDPQLVGLGGGRTLISPVLEWVRSNWPNMKLRAVVQEWNERSLRLCLALGFEEVNRLQVVQKGQTVTYVVLVTPNEE